MKNGQKRFMALLAMALMCVFMTSAVAADTQPDETWMAEHLLTSVPVEDGTELLPLADVIAKDSADGVTLEAEPAATLEKNADCTVTLNLILVDREDAEPTWTLDMAAPLTLNDAKAEVLLENDDTITAPSEQEIADLLEISGLCAHGETALETEKVAHTVIAYKDEDGVIRTAVTISPKAVAAAATRVLGTVHGAGQINELKAVYTLVEAEDDWTLTGMKLVFRLTCGGTDDGETSTTKKYTVTYTDGCNGKAFPKETYKVVKGKATPAPKVDVSDPDALRPGYRFIGWDKELSETVTGNVTYTAQWIKLHTVAYSDGADGAVFATQTYIVEDGAATPACTADMSDPDAVRDGYRFLGWSPAIAATATGDVTYTAQWVKLYTVTYVDGQEGAIFEEESYIVADGEATPVCSVDVSDPEALWEKHRFMGWDPEVAETVTGDVTYTAKWIAAAYFGPGNTAMGTVMNDPDHPWAIFHCTSCEDHHDYALLTVFENAHDNEVGLGWDEEKQAYVGTVTIHYSTLLDYPYLSKCYVAYNMGKIKHYAEDGEIGYTLHAIWVPDETAQYGGMWYPDGETPVINVYCHTEPVAPTAEQLSDSTQYKNSTKLWVRDWTNTKNYQNPTTLLPGTFTVGEMTGNMDDGWYITITITDLEPYADLLNGKSTGSYTVDEINTKAPLTYRMKYTFTPPTSSRNPLEPRQDGLGWTIDTSDWTATEVKNGKTIWAFPQWTITYTDGVDGQAFEDKVYVSPEDMTGVAQNYLQKNNFPTPVWNIEDPEALWAGHRLVGWDPEVAPVITDNATYTAKWADVYSITYENVPDGVENSNPVSYAEMDTPITLADLNCDGFLGWLDADGNKITEIAEGTTGDLVIKANIVSKPAYPKDGTNISPNLYTIQCTTVESHAYTHNAQLYVNTSRPTNNDLAWNEATKRWEITAEIKFNNFINSTQIRTNYFGGFNHHWDLGTGADKNPKIRLYWAPDAEGSTSLGAPITGMWYAVEGNPVVLNVFCYDKPAAPAEATVTKLTGSFYRIQDFTKNTVYVNFTKLKAGTFTIGEVYGNATDGWKADVTVTDMQSYYDDFLAKCTDDADYAIAQAASNTKTTWTLNYTGSTTDYKQDGTGWTLDKTIGGPNYATNTEKMNGRYINFYPTWKTTYTDGVEGEEVFADQTYTSPATIRATAFNAGEDYNVRKSGIGMLPTTPFNNEADAVPVRPGYTFTGWEPAWSEYVSAHVTYTATWSKDIYTVTYTDGVDDVEIFAPQVYEECSYGDKTPAFQGTPAREGYAFIGWTPEVAETVTGNVEYTAVWKKIVTVIYTDGVDGEEIFADQVHENLLEGDKMPPFEGDEPTREGYAFVGWQPALMQTVPANDVTFVAQWKKYCTVIYTDGQGGSVFATERYENVLEGSETPECTVDVSDPDKLIEGYRFMGWDPEWSATVTGDVTYTAKFAKLYTVTYFDWYDQKVLDSFTVPEGEPTPVLDYNDYTKSSYVNLGWTTEIAPIVTEDVTYTMMQMVPPRTHNVVGLTVAIDCVVEDKHDNSSYTWFTKGSLMMDGDGVVSYDASQDKYIGTVTIKDDLSELLASYSKHEHELVSVSHKTFTLTFDMAKKNWVSDIDTITVTTKCPDAPAVTAATNTTIASAKVRMLDTKTGTIKWYNRPLVEGTYSVGAVRGSRSEGGWYFDVTITDFGPYLEQYHAKYGTNYAVNEEKTGTLVFTFKYAYSSNGSTVVKTDGTGWKWDTTGLSVMDKTNGKPIYMDNLYTVTYIDGVEDEVVFEDRIFIVREGAATPDFDGDLTREGFIFGSWMPDRAATVTKDVTYIARWLNEDGSDLETPTIFETPAPEVPVPTQEPVQPEEPDAPAPTQAPAQPEEFEAPAPTQAPVQPEELEAPAPTQAPAQPEDPAGDGMTSPTDIIP